jgi:hypothetical protein
MRLPLLLVAFVDLLLKSRGFRGNAARRALRPISRRLRPLHPRRMAHNGDSGRGLFEHDPWYDVYWTVDLTADLDEVVTSAARDAGYHLHVDDERIRSLSQQGKLGHLRPEHFNPTSSYLTAKDVGRELVVTITRDGEVPVYGRGPVHAYGAKRSPSPGHTAIVALSLSLPGIR